MRGLKLMLLFSGWIGGGICFNACSPAAAPPLFYNEPETESGIGFSNPVTESDSVNLFINEYLYMGGGVGIGDFNQDGRPDIFFAGNQVSSRLYLNEDGRHYRDVTASAGVATTAWCTGVSVADINNDGYPDIYLCVSGNVPGKTRRNLLFINNGKGAFTEQAAEYGLAYSGYCTQAAFLDYDGDGDLDMFLLNHRLDHFRPNDIDGRDTSGHSPAADKLFRNTGIKNGHPYYEDATAAAGIRDDGYGLGVVVSDLNGDRWPDIYVSNDYLGNDELWLNNRNGTFTNVVAAAVKHQSYSGMGVDAADINNDGRPDLVTLDMMPPDNTRKKTMYSFMSYERYQLERDKGYQPEFVRNMLQVNRGDRGELPFFSEIGQQAGIAETDWSWSALIADFDNDGWKDIHITNGMGRDLTNADFVQFRADSQLEDNRAEGAARTRLRKKLDSYGPVALVNAFFHNDGNFHFSDAAAAAGITAKTISTGAAYADLDGNGTPDLVVSNSDRPAGIFLSEARRDSAHTHYLKIALTGDRYNRDAVGSKVTVYISGTKRVAELFPVRGYLSTVDKVLHFGLDSATRADSVEVLWPGGKRNLLRNQKADVTIHLSYGGLPDMPAGSPPAVSPLFRTVPGNLGVRFRHREMFFNDYSFQPLLPQKYSQPGPMLTAGDMNGDGLADFFAGGAFGQSGQVFLQQPSGSFTASPLDTGKKPAEDTGSALFDANGDGYPDLLVAGGSDEFSPGAAVYTPRLYLNDGRGHFTFSPGAVGPDINTSASVVAAADMDGDGYPEVFVGGRVSNRYPESPRSFLLRARDGRLTDITPQVAPALVRGGMITSALWSDLDGDGKPELVVAGDWMPVRIFQYSGGRLTERTAVSGLAGFSGQWRALTAADIDGDGDIDLIAGNLGSNNRFHVDATTPLLLYSADLDQNGSQDPLPFYFILGPSGKRELYPALGRDQFSLQVPGAKKHFLYYADYARAGFGGIFSESQAAALQRDTCNETRSLVFLNDGHGHFTARALPAEAQFAPVNAIVARDFDGDGKTDLLLAGNEYQTEVMTGRYDASWGLLLTGDGRGGFRVMDPAQSGFVVDGDVKGLVALAGAEKQTIVIAGVNDDSLRVFRAVPGIKSIP